MTTNKNLTPSILWLALATLLLLLIPLIAMQFSPGVVWTLGDFIFAGSLIFGTGLTYMAVTQQSASTRYRMAVGVALASGFILIWANGAVGLIGSEANAINIWYYGVILPGLIGAFVSRLRAKGMAYTMGIMGIAQAIIAAVALAGGYHRVPHSSVSEVIGVNAFFITLFVVSALLFNSADKDKALINEPVKK